VGWRANGDYYSLSENMVRLHAPSVSGVYGLYNLRHQILIGHSANIQSALLRHLAVRNFRLRRFVPTGFVFEACPPEARESRAQELIREYDPILQTNRPLAALWHSWTARGAIAFYPHGATANAPPSDEPSRNRVSLDRGRKRLRLDREQFFISVTGFGTILMAMGLIALLLNLKDDSGVSWQTASRGKNLTSNANEIQVASLASAQASSAPDRSGEQTDILERTSKPTIPPQAGIALEQPEIFVASELTNRDSVGREDKLALPGRRASAAEKSHSAYKERERNGWTVQALATIDRGIAVDCLERLKVKGYSAFVVQAEVNGQTWYRVRAGHFHTRAEAESLRETLQSQEGFRDAFIAASARSETVVALNPQ
jgi:cell division septation protein DedD